MFSFRRLFVSASVDDLVCLGVPAGELVRDA
jgi:hypothetical protein